jgi:hypothetical protein
MIGIGEHRPLAHCRKARLSIFQRPDADARWNGVRHGFNFSLARPMLAR